MDFDQLETFLEVARKKCDRLIVSVDNTSAQTSESLEDPGHHAYMLASVAFVDAVVAIGRVPHAG